MQVALKNSTFSYPFGSLKPLRYSGSNDYRFGFNGMEVDDEVKGDNNSLDFGARIYDPRIGRFLSLDPKWKSFPFMSPYVFAGNNPLRFIDKEGNNPDDVIKLSLDDLGKQEGYIIMFNKETEQTIITKTAVTYNNRSNISKNAVTFTLTETITRLDEKGNITSIVEVETDIRAKAERTKNFLGAIGFKLISNEQSKTIGIKSGNRFSDPTGLLLQKDNIVNEIQGLLKSINRTSMSTGEGLPGLSIMDAIELNLPKVIKVSGVLTNSETIGIDLIDFETGSPSTTLNIPKSEVKKAAYKIHKAATNKPVKQM
jgi:RHS repeat-associated protein